MKKILFVAAIAAATLSSCSKNEVSTSNLDNQALSFGVYTGTTTKSGEITTNSLAAYGFGVFGYYKAYDGTALTFDSANDQPNFMYNQAVYGLGSSGNQITNPNNSYNSIPSWDYTPQKYWPNNTNDILSFAAYGPYSAGVSGTDCITFTTGGNGTAYTNATAGLPQLTYTILADGKTADLVAAAPVYGSKNESAYNAVNSTVNFTFKHLLTRVKFSAYLEVTDFTAISDDGTTAAGDNTTVTVNGAETKVYVTKMVILGNSGTGGYVDKTGAAVTSKSTGLYSSNTFTYVGTAGDGSAEVSGVGSWSSTTPTAYTSDYDLATLLDKVATTEIFDTYTPGTDGSGNLGVDVTSTTVATPTPLFIQEEGTTPEEYLFLLPVTNGLAAGTSEMYVYIEYDVVTLDSKLDSGYSSITNKDVIQLPDGGLKLGTAYNYVLTIGLDEVTVSATVDDWTETTYYDATPE